MYIYIYIHIFIYMYICIYISIYIYNPQLQHSMIVLGNDRGGAWSPPCCGARSWATTRQTTEAALKLRRFLRAERLVRAIPQPNSCIGYRRLVVRPMSSLKICMDFLKKSAWKSLQNRSIFAVVFVAWVLKGETRSRIELQTRPGWVSRVTTKGAPPSCVV